MDFAPADTHFSGDFSLRRAEKTLNTVYHKDLRDSTADPPAL